MPVQLLVCHLRAVFMTNKKNRAFNKLFDECINNNKRPEKTNVRYRSNEGMKQFNISISLIQSEETLQSGPQTFPGMMVLIEDTTDRFTLRQHEHDCAYIFAGLIICTKPFSFCLEPVTFYSPYIPKVFYLYIYNRMYNICIIP